MTFRSNRERATPEKGWRHAFSHQGENIMHIIDHYYPYTGLYTTDLFVYTDWPNEPIGMARESRQRFLIDAHTWCKSVRGDTIRVYMSTRLFGTWAVNAAGYIRTAHGDMRPMEYVMYAMACRSLAQGSDDFTTAAIFR
jgi:hypothetical protein